jgi:hypothetical protein
MIVYYPKDWVILQITENLKTGNTGYGQKELISYKILGGFGTKSGFGGDVGWRMNAGITRIVKQGKEVCFYEGDRSVYVVEHLAYGLSPETTPIFNKVVVSGTVRMLPCDVEWANLLKEGYSHAKSF